MAISLTTIRNNILTSLFGRRLGLKPLVPSDPASEHLLGMAGEQLPVTDATSDTTGTNITAYGITTVNTTTNDTWLLDPPLAGVLKRIVFITTSTGVRTIMRKDATFAIESTGSSTGTTIAAQSGGMSLVLQGVSATAYVIVSKPGTTELAINGTT